LKNSYTATLCAVFQTEKRPQISHSKWQIIFGIWYEKPYEGPSSGFENLFFFHPSPELNPVERFWLQIKRATTKNKVYQSFAQLEDAVCACLQKIAPQDIAKACAINWFN